MNTYWVVAGLLGLSVFLGALLRAAWAAQDHAGHWRPGGWRWLALAAAGFLLLAGSLRLAGVPDSAVRYPLPEPSRGTDVP